MTNLKRYLTASMILASTPAIAGEITGNGSLTPVNGYIASSICSFSGRNDDGSGPSDLVQSYGVIIASLGGHATGGPGTSCRGNL